MTHLFDFLRQRANFVVAVWNVKKNICTSTCWLSWVQSESIVSFSIDLIRSFFSSLRSGSIDINSALIIKGRFQQKQIESVLRLYISKRENARFFVLLRLIVRSFAEEYVICKTCRSADTTLQKEERLTVLFCNNCRSRYFVTGIKTGFQAQVGKRAATRAKATWTWFSPKFDLLSCLFLFVSSFRSAPILFQYARKKTKRETFFHSCSNCSDCRWIICCKSSPLCFAQRNAFGRCPRKSTWKRFSSPSRRIFRSFKPLTLAEDVYYPSDRTRNADRCLIIA